MKRLSILFIFVVCAVQAQEVEEQVEAFSEKPLIAEACDAGRPTEMTPLMEITQAGKARELLALLFAGYNPLTVRYPYSLIGGEYTARRIAREQGYTLCEFLLECYERDWKTLGNAGRHGRSLEGVRENLVSIKEHDLE